MTQRPIKFRAWDTERKEMCFPLKLTFLFETERGISAEVPENDTASKELFRDIFPENLILEQFTGLLDKNGGEIYEGDILKVTANAFSTRENVFGEVYWFNGHQRFALRNVDFYLDSLNEYEVIGNIHENPDLLK